MRLWQVLPRSSPRKRRSLLFLNQAYIGRVNEAVVVDVIAEIRRTHRLADLALDLINVAPADLSVSRPISQQDARVRVNRITHVTGGILNKIRRNDDSLR